MPFLAAIPLATWGMIAVGTAAVAATTGTVLSSVAQSKAAEYQAKVARNQAIAVEQQAAWEAEKVRIQARHTLAKQRALWGKAGIVATEGTPLLVAMKTAEQYELDARLLEHQGQVGAGSYRAEAGLNEMAAGNALIGGAISGTGTLLAGVGQVIKQ